jgi:serine/threonine protein kinase
MNETENTPAAKPLIDEYGNIHYPLEELARGGQGVVFCTTDADLAIKQPLDAEGSPDKNANLRERFRNVRLLPLPARISISLPLAILREEPGYVMRLLNGMKPFSVFDLNGTTKKEMEERELELPPWLAGIPDKDMALRLLYYADTGSTRRRLRALAKCASILARLHGAGLVYGDISTNNAFIGEGPDGEVWLIDADNLRFEVTQGGASVYTPGFGAPEIVRGTDCSRPRTDCWGFAVMAFKILALCHPFIGKKVVEPDDDEGGWDAEPVAEGAPLDPDEQAYAGHLPFIDDQSDDSNPGVGGLPRELLLTPKLGLLFQETFGSGRLTPHRRPAAGFWAIEMIRAYDLSLDCQECKMSYFADDHEKCPYCGATRPPFLRARTPRWETLIPRDAAEFSLPHRLFHAFSFELHDEIEHEGLLDFSEKTATPVRGTKPFPENLTFEFVEEAK